MVPLGVPGPPFNAPNGVVSEPTGAKLAKLNTLKNEKLGVMVKRSWILIGHAKTVSKSRYHVFPVGLFTVARGVPPLMVAPSSVNSVCENRPADTRACPAGV